MTNYAPPPQLIQDVPYRDLDEMRAFARRWREEHRGQWFTAPKLSGFCLLMKRAVYEAIGGLDDQFGLGFFDDDDLAIRARRAGFELAVAHDLFVHHFGSRTFAGNGIDAERLLSENQQRFAAKWGSLAPQGERVHYGIGASLTTCAKERPTTAVLWCRRPACSDGRRRRDACTTMMRRRRRDACTTMMRRRRRDACTTMMRRRRRDAYTTMTRAGRKSASR